MTIENTVVETDLNTLFSELALNPKEWIFPFEKAFAGESEERMGGRHHVSGFGFITADGHHIGLGDVTVVNTALLVRLTGLRHQRQHRFIALACKAMHTAKARVLEVKVRWGTETVRRIRFELGEEGGGYWLDNLTISLV